MKTILLTDPVYTRLMLERTCLSRRGHALLEAHTGSQGLKLAREHHPHLILFPTNLGDLDGAAFCKAIREDPGTRHASLLLVVSNDSDEAVRRVMQAGANDFLTMPLRHWDLDHKLSIFLNIETRKTVRILVQTQVYTPVNRGFLLGTSINVSASGLLLESHAVFAEGASMHLRFFLPGIPKQIDAEARVVRVEKHPGVLRYGLHFDRIEKEDMELLRQFALASAGS